VDRSCLGKRMRCYDNGKVGRETKAWHDAGRPSKISVQEVRSWIQSHPPGQTIGTEAVDNMLDSRGTEKMSEQTRRNIRLLDVSMCKAMCNDPSYKTPHPDAAEKSLHRVQSFTVGMVGSHIQAGPSEVGRAPNRKNKADQMASKALGDIVVHLVDEAMIFNMDDVSNSSMIMPSPPSRCKVSRTCHLNLRIFHGIS
jgi:hypothetical protein